MALRCSLVSPILDEDLEELKDSSKNVRMRLARL